MILITFTGRFDRRQRGSAVRTGCWAWPHFNRLENVGLASSDSTKAPTIPPSGRDVQTSVPPAFPIWIPRGSVLVQAFTYCRLRGTRHRARDSSGGIEETASSGEARDSKPEPRSRRSGLDIDLSPKRDERRNRASGYRRSRSEHGAEFGANEHEEFSEVRTMSIGEEYSDRRGIWGHMGERKNTYGIPLFCVSTRLHTQTYRYHVTCDSRRD